METTTIHTDPAFAAIRAAVVDKLRRDAARRIAQAIETDPTAAKRYNDALRSVRQQEKDR